MIDQELIDILACPETKQAVRLTDLTLIKKLNDDIALGRIKNRKGALVTEKIEGGLVREDNKFLYAIRDDIPIMLIDEAIPLPL